MLYFIVISSSFRKSSLDEIGKFSKFRVVEEFNNMMIIDAASKRLEKQLKDAIFTCSIFKLYAPSSIDKKRYLDSIYKSILKSGISKKKRIKLECVDINSRNGYSAKDVEVRLGLRLEKDGFTPDLENPEILVYFVLFNMKCYVGEADYMKLRKKFVNPMRYYHTDKRISRAELKLEEAFDEFGMEGGGMAIDLGAAPGGWTAFLAKKGYKPIAIDNANLDYQEFINERLKVAVLGGYEKIDIQKEFQDADVIHVKDGFKNAAKIIKVSGASLLADDMNISCKDTANAIHTYLKFLKKGAKIVVTIKCVTKNVPKYIDQAKKLIGKDAQIKGVKVLPSNRQEVTIFAVMPSNHQSK